MKKVIEFLKEICERTVRDMCNISKCECNDKVMTDLLKKALYITIAMLAIAGVVYYAFNMKALSYFIITYAFLDFTVISTGVNTISEREAMRYIEEEIDDEELKDVLKKLI